jgi:hypothetical protein
VCACDYGKPVAYSPVNARANRVFGTATPDVRLGRGVTLVVGRPVMIRAVARRRRFDMDKKAKTPKKPKQPKTGADKKK